MTKPVLYLMVGYPGSGKTTISKLINELTGAEHLWADHLRREKSNPPTYSHQENVELYDHMNKMTEELLKSGKSVVFDTNFNFFQDRDHLRKIAAKHGAREVTIWVTTPYELSKTRATQALLPQETRLLGTMPLRIFKRLSHNLQPPSDDENTISINGSDVSLALVKGKLAGAGLLGN